MNRVSAADVKEFIVSYLSKTAELSGRTMDSAPSDDLDLFQEGIIDSLGMFNLIAELEQHFECAIDFEGLDPEAMTVIGPLCRYVERMLR